MRVAAFYIYIQLSTLSTYVLKTHYTHYNLVFLFTKRNLIIHSNNRELGKPPPSSHFSFFLLFKVFSLSSAKEILQNRIRSPFKGEKNTLSRSRYVLRRTWPVINFIYSPNSPSKPTHPPPFFLATPLPYYHPLHPSIHSSISSPKSLHHKTPPKTAKPSGARLASGKIPTASLIQHNSPKEQRVCQCQCQCQCQLLPHAKPISANVAGRFVLVNTVIENVQRFYTACF